MVVKKPRIVIVGAGMAGLTAAHRLHTAAGGLFDLCVVEAGDRIGGRILTAEFAGDRVEMGATWIHGIGGSPIYALAHDIHALSDDTTPWERMDGFPEDPVTVAEGGTIVDSSVVGPVSALYRRLMDAARSGDAPLVEGPGVASFLRRGLQQYRTSRSVGSGDGVGVGVWTLEALEEAVFAMHENTERTCTSADELTELDLAAESEYRDFPGDQITIARGYSRVIEWFAAALPPGAIRLGRRLRRIEWLPDGGGGGTDLRPSDGPVRLHFDDLTVSAADHVIITVSLGVLKAGLRKDAAGDPPSSGVVFSPGLPPFKKDAIGRLGFGLVNKLFMEVDGGEGPFPFLQMAFEQGPGPARHLAKIPRWMRRTAFICPIYGGSRVLLAWIAGEEAMELEAMGDEEIIRGLRDTLDGFLPAKPDGRCNGVAAAVGSSGGGYRRIKSMKRSGWGTNPLFLGSYSYVAVGSSGDDLDLMAEPLPRRGGDGGRGGGGAPLPPPPPPPPLQILFAGEATHRTHYSTTHGAYFSGIREANRLLQHYRCINS